MPTSRTWAAVAAGAGIGLLLAALGIALWWTLSKDGRTLQVVDNSRELEGLLEKAPFVALHEGGRMVTVISPRHAYGLEQWLGEDAEQLSQKGRGVRAILVPSGHGGASEEATVVELWQGRSAVLLRQWLSLRAEHWTAVGIQSASASRERMAALAEANAMRGAVMRASGASEDDSRWPLVVWRDGAGQLAVCRCYTPEALAKARAALGLGAKALPEAIQPVRHFAPVTEEAPTAPATDAYPKLAPPAQTEPTSLSSEEIMAQGSPYRTPSPLLPGDAGLRQDGMVASEPAPVPKAATPSVRRPKPARADINTAPPKAEKDAESLFY